jgi:hypothetical protein
MAKASSPPINVYRLKDRLLSIIRKGYYSDSFSKLIATALIGRLIEFKCMLLQITAGLSSQIHIN